MKSIPLTQGYEATVDDSDYEQVSQFQWHFAKGNRTNYAARGVKVNGKMKRIYLHRQLLGSPPKSKVDHRDGNGLNNRRENIRPATSAQNGQNSVKIQGRSSQFKGVTVSKRPPGWKASIRVNGRGIHLGYFSVETDAAHAYDDAARTYFGEFACPNFIL